MSTPESHSPSPAPAEAPVSGVPAVAFERLLIRGGQPLRGRVASSGSKNAALYTLAASLLAPEPVTVRNLPAIADIGQMLGLLGDLGARVEQVGDTARVDASALSETVAPTSRATALRASFLVMGPLLARLGEAACAPPGGDVIGVRPLDVHLAGFRALGATVAREGGAWVARTGAGGLRGTRVFLDYPSVLGTVNVLFAATRARGTTVIVNAAAEPEVAMVAEMLLSMGARIRGHGSQIVEVEGVERLHGTDFTVIPDRIEAGTFLLAAAATGGAVGVEGVVPAHMDGVLTKLAEAGARLEGTETSVSVDSAGGLEAVQLQAVPYPGFPTDLHAPIAAALTQAAGVSIIHERVFDNRLLYVGELRAMGARLTTGGQSVIIEGPTRLSGTPVRALDVRAGAAVVIAALAAEGETEVRGLEHIDRGYQHLVDRLSALGASIERVGAAA
ncbi:MAG: UDP-N-acetylglucosamine 1-carboxyvinyltransferase [Chloroflexi bacterium]|nr:UDP-N-acetylglucosamine 1-carboxyvinyltransferase [Chloroflexota bacterium]